MINKIVNKFVSQPVWSPWVALSPSSADSNHSLDLLLQIHPLLLLHQLADHLCQPLCFHPFCQTCPSPPSSCPSLAQVAQHCHSCYVPLHHQRIPLVLVQQSCHSRSSCRWRKIRWCFGDLRRVLNANALLWKCAKLQIVNLYWGTTSCPSVLLKPSLSVGKPRLGPGPWTPISGSSARFDVSIYGLLNEIYYNMIMLNDNLYEEFQSMQCMVLLPWCAFTRQGSKPKWADCLAMEVRGSVRGPSCVKSGLPREGKRQLMGKPRVGEGQLMGYRLEPLVQVGQAVKQCWRGN